jgi:hypothetical protein
MTLNFSVQPCVLWYQITALEFQPIWFQGSPNGFSGSTAIVRAILVEPAWGWPL